jgi:predicted AAA+ superfamily ATPase
LLRQVIDRLISEGIPASNILYLNKEYTAFDFVTGYKILDELFQEYLQELKPSGRIFLFLDEVQEIEGWERFVNSYSQSHADDIEIFISGSNARMLSGDLATLLSGRYIEFEVFPYSYMEFIGYNQLDKDKQSYLRFMQTGGLPELFHLSSDETRRYYMSALRDTVLLRDIVQRQNIKDIRLLEDIFAFLVNNASSLISVNSLVRYFAGRQRKTNYETISNYIGYMEAAFLVHQALRYRIKGKEIMAGNCKYYINDLSFRNYLYPGFDYGYGYMLENLVYLQLKSRGYEVFVGHMRGREIDFVALKNNRVLYLQAAYQLYDKAVIDREYSQLEAIPDNYEKYVVSVDDLALPDRNGIHHILAWQLDEIL